MQTKQPSLSEYLQALTEMESLYPRVLPLTMWRAWEVAIYRRYQLPEPIMDLGCGDGRFLRQVWQNISEAVGVDIDQVALHGAKRSGTYQRIHFTPASQIPEPDESFRSVFSNCAMEHMSEIEKVIQEAYRLLKPGGSFLFSVVTSHLLGWAPLPQFLSVLNLPQEGEKLTDEYVQYHHLVNPFSAEEWTNLLERNGFEVQEHYPILPDTFARAFLVLDQLWHVPYHTSEVGVPVLSHFETLPNFLEGVKDITSGLWKLSHPELGAGAVFYAQKPLSSPRREKNMPEQTACWCGSQKLRSYSHFYNRCETCGSLVLRYSQDATVEPSGHSAPQGETAPNFSAPVLTAFQTLLRYKTPPASLISRGNLSGDVSSALQFFGYPIPTHWETDEAFAGQVPDESLDAILLFGVLEHQPDPRAALTLALQKLKPDGVLLLQTQKYPEETLQETDATPVKLPFHLFSHLAVQKLLDGLHSAEIEFDPASPLVFYDRFIVASKTPLSENTTEQMTLALQQMPKGTLAQKLLDLHQNDRRHIITQNDLRARLSETQAALEFTHEALVQSNVVLGEHQAHLAQTQESLAQTQESLAQTQESLAQTQESLAQTQKNTDEISSQFANALSQLETADIALTEAYRELQIARQALVRFQNSRVYKILQRAGLLNWMSDYLSQIKR